jgi:hypothetical protein
MRRVLLPVLALALLPASVEALPLGVTALPQARLPSIPVVLGCHLVGAVLICGGDSGETGGGLLLRRRRKDTVEPEQGTKPSEPKYTYSKKHHVTKSTSGGAATSAKPVNPVASTAGTSAPAEHSCPPGSMVLSTPDAAGSYCQAVSPANTTTTAPAGATTQPSASTTPVQSTSTQTTAAPVSQNPATTGAWCCTADSTLNGQPAPAQQACGADQNSAMSSLVTASMAQKLTLGAITCSGH